LKLSGNYITLRGSVAPRAGAWIETDVYDANELMDVSPPVRGRGLKRVSCSAMPERLCRPPCGGVD